MKIQDIVVNEASLLTEFRASPSALKSLASGINAKVGIEFEMLYPDADTEDLRTGEADYSDDPRVFSIQDLIEFFLQEDANSRRDLERLGSQLEDEYIHWLRDIAFREFEQADTSGLVAEKVKAENPRDAWIRDEQVSLGASDGDSAYEEFIESEVQSEIAREGPLYDEVMTEWIDEWIENTRLDSEDFLKDEYGVRHMSDAEGALDLNWPHIRYGGGTSLEEIANDLSDTLGTNVVVGYSAEYRKWVVTTDSSISGEPEYGGIEIVSPILTVPQAIEATDTIRKWAHYHGAETNNTTGLHINVSVDNFKEDELDYTKLALLVGDEYILNQYQRLGNSFARSAVSNIVNNLSKISPENVESILSLMKGGFDKVSTHVVRELDTKEKYTSISLKSDRIEFRSPGGDWLNEDAEKIEATIL